MAPKKQPVSKDIDTKVVSAEPSREVIAFDEGSFVRAERRELQAKYNRHFDDLLLYIETGLTLRDVGYQRDSDGSIVTVLPPPAPEPILGLDGAPVFADDVLIEMLTIIAKRDNPAASSAMFDDYTTTDLVESIRAGKAAARAKRASQT